MSYQSDFPVKEESSIAKKYDPVSILSEKGQRILDLAKDGYLKVEIAAELGIPIRKLSEFIKTYPDFAELMEMATTLSQAWWVKRARIAVMDKNDKFAAIPWYATMKNAYGWGDKPSERFTENLDEYRGNLQEKINTLDKKLANGFMAPEGYGHMMKSLSYHATINELTIVQPQLALIDIDKKVSSGEMTHAEGELEKEYIKRHMQIAEAAAEAIFAQDKILNGKMTCKQHRMVPKKKNDSQSKDLDNLQSIPVDEGFEAQLKKKVAADRKKAMNEKKRQSIRKGMPGFEDKFEDKEDDVDSEVE